MEAGQEKCLQKMPELDSERFPTGADNAGIPSEKKGSQVEEDFSSPTPLKTREPSRIMCMKEEAELPERYKILSDFFNSMTCSLRLLNLRKKLPTFHNICRQVQVLSGRRFLPSHLAQIKYIIPEAVQIDRILVHDEKTLCMKPDMKISLLFDVVKGHQEESVFIALRTLFSSKLKDLYTTHSEETDIPEAVLPEPFNCGSMNVKADPSPEDTLTCSQANVPVPSHLSSSFSKRFSQKATSAEMEKTCLLSSSDSVADRDIKRLKLSDSSSKSTDIADRVTQTPFCINSSTRENTPMKVLSGSDNVLLETPVQLTPMRSISPSRSTLTCEDESKTATSQNITPCNLSAKRSLDFYYMGGESSICNDGMDKCEDRNAFSNTEPKGISVKMEERSCCADESEKNWNSISSNKQMSTCLSDLVHLVNSIFQSHNFCSITKEELIHKIIMYNCDIEEHGEAEKQIEMLEKLVPDWLYKKLAPSGDLLYNVKKVSDLNSVRARIDVI